MRLLVTLLASLALAGCVYKIDVQQGNYVTQDVVAKLKSRRPDLHVVVTGRNAKRELIEAADLVTEMTLLKHPFRAGVKAQPGIEF